MFTLMAVGGRGEGGVATGSQEGLLGDAIVDTEGAGVTSPPGTLLASCGATK